MSAPSFILAGVDEQNARVTFKIRFTVVMSSWDERGQRIDAARDWLNDHAPGGEDRVWAVGLHNVFINDHRVAVAFRLRFC